MAQIKLSAFTREQRGKGPARRLRAQGQFPGVLYGGGQDARSLAFNAHDFDVLLAHGMTSASLISLDIEGSGKPELAVLRELQRDPVTRKVRHVDFYRVNLDQMVEFEIPVHAIGDCDAVRAGGLLEHITRRISIRCTPDKVPASIDVSIKDLDFGKAIHLSDITLPEGIEAVTEPGAVLFAVVMPRAAVSQMAEGEEVAAETPAEPELIGKGKGEESES